MEQKPVLAKLCSFMLLSSRSLSSVQSCTALLYWRRVTGYVIARVISINRNEEINKQSISLILTVMKDISKYIRIYSLELPPEDKQLKVAN